MSDTKFRIKFLLIESDEGGTLYPTRMDSINAVVQHIKLFGGIPCSLSWLEEAEVGDVCEFNGGIIVRTNKVVLE